MLSLVLLLACGQAIDTDTPTDTDDPNQTQSNTDTEEPTDTGPVDADADGYPLANDCDDDDADVHPFADERCNEADDDCDGDVDEHPTDGSTYYLDADGDGFGNEDYVTVGCEVPSGYTDDTGLDCDDGDAQSYPGSTEVCGGGDEDCDGSTDEVGAADVQTWYADGDGDGYGDPDTTTDACDVPSGSVADNDDCDDGDTGVFPYAAESCDEVDEDCDGDVGEDALDGLSYYVDADGDGYGDDASSIRSCDAPSGYAADGGDCDDDDASVHPDAEELCDTADQDCDGNPTGALGVPDAYSSIQDAIDAASAGDTVCVAAGTYSETLDFGGTDLALVSAGGSGSTILDGTGVGPVLRFTSGESTAASVTGFTVTGGEASEGAGVYVEGADPTFADLLVSGNTCSSSSCLGTGMYFATSTSSLTDVWVSDNDGNGTSEVHGTGVYATDSSLSLEEVWVTDNTATTSGSASQGGTFYIGGSSELVWIGGGVVGNAMTNTRSSGNGAGGACSWMLRPCCRGL